MAKDKLIERMKSLEKLLKEFLEKTDVMRAEENTIIKDIEEFTLHKNKEFLDKFYSKEAEEESRKGFG